MFDKFSRRVALVQVWGFHFPTQVLHLMHLVWVVTKEGSELVEGEGELVENMN